jgi:uncharacterized protein YjbJ (UPF0337 family)
MTDEQVKGVVGNMAGKIQQAAGSLTGDTGLKVEGAVREAAGKAEAAYGDAVEAVRDYAARKPISAVAIGVGLGVLATLLLRRNND